MKFEFWDFAREILKFAKKNKIDQRVLSRLSKLVRNHRIKVKSYFYCEGTYGHLSEIEN